MIGVGIRVFPWSARKLRPGHLRVGGVFEGLPQNADAAHGEPVFWGRGPVRRKETVKTMMMKLVLVAGALSLMACGSGKQWDGMGEGPPGMEIGGAATAGGPGAAGGGSIAQGGEASSWGGSGSMTGGACTGGISSGGVVQVGGGYPVGGEGGVTEGEAGTASGGAEQGGGAYGGASQVGGSGAVGGGGSELSCLANVAHCFDAAANCFEYSPGSDCDKIVDVCAALQADCEAPTP